MCRIAAYLGPELGLHDLLVAPAHSLYRQSWAPREMRTAVVNADGWGAGWFAGGRPAVYRNTLPIWADRNLDALGRSLHAPAWVANVRSATAGLGTHDVNTQPFASDELLFTHNGFITDFSVALRRRLRAALPDAIEAQILGNTDSEHLFALIQTFAADGGLQAELRAAIAWLREALAGSGTTALLSIVLCDGESIVAARAAIGADCPSLYWHPAHTGFGGGALVASEAFDEDPGWRAIPEQHLVVLHRERAPSCSPI